MTETESVVTLESVDLKMHFSWRTKLEPKPQKKKTVLSHSSLPGVEWQLELDRSKNHGVAVNLVMVTNKHNFDLNVTFTIVSMGSVNGKLGKSSKQSKLRLTVNGFVTPQEFNQNRNQNCFYDQRCYVQGNPQYIRNVARTAAVISIDLKGYIEFNCPLTKVPSDAALNGEVGKLLTEGFKSDVEFVVQDVTIPAHKLLLSAASPVFDRMFADESEFEEARSNTVIIDDVSPEAFEAFLRLVYTGDIDHDTLQKDDTALEVMSLGHRYQVDSIVRRASHAIKVGLTIDTVLQAAEASRLFEDKELQEACADYIAEDSNFDEISKKIEWTSFIAQNASLVNYLLLKMRHRTAP